MEKLVKSLGITIFAVLMITSVIVISSPSISATSFSVRIRINDLYENYDAHWTTELPGPPYYYRDVLAGGTAVCKVWVTNMGTNSDNYTLSITHNPSGWSATLDVSLFPNVAGGDSRLTYLRVIVPSGANFNDNDNIGITVAHTGGGGVSGENFVIIRTKFRLAPTMDDTFATSYDKQDVVCDQAKSETIYTGIFGTPGPTQENQYGLFKFDLRGIPANYAITTAKFWINVYRGYENNSSTLVQTRTTFYTGLKMTTGMKRH